MAPIKKQIRTNQALQVIKHSNDGMSISQACREAHIARSTFYLFCERNPDVIANFQELQQAHAIEELLIILGNRNKMVELMCEDAVSEKTKPLKRLRIIQYMDKRMEELDYNLRTNSPRASQEEVTAMLTGPELRPGKSRFHSSEIPARTIDIQMTSENEIPVDEVKPQ